MMVEFLYRGFNSTKDTKSALTPKNQRGSMALGAECGDERVQCGDDDFTAGISVANALHFHEYGRNGDETGYLSFTPHFERAKAYALGDGKYEKGTVIKVATQTLIDLGFDIFPVNDTVRMPACKEDEEHSIYVGSQSFPDEAIIDEYIVYKDLF